VDIFTRVEGGPVKPKREDDSEYAKYKKSELVKMLEERDEEAAASFKQDPSAIDRVTEVVTPAGISAPEEGGPEANWHDDAAIYELISDEKIEMMTVLRKAQIRAFARGWWIATHYEYEFGREFIRTMLKFAISGEGLGRSQFLKALMSGHPVEGMAMEEESSRGLSRLGEIIREKF